MQKARPEQSPPLIKVRSKCYVTGEGSILSSDGITRHAGGIAGDNSGVISNCYNLIPLEVNTISGSYLGGIAGYNTGTIKYCFATGKVLAADAVVSNIADGEDSKIAGEIVGFNNHEYTGVVRNCVAVNAMIPTEAHRVIGTGGGVNDTNNFSFYEMPRPITKAADVYDPLEGTPLTKDHLNSDAGGCFNDWETSAWDMSNISTHLPKLQGYTAQTEIAIAPYLPHTIKFNTPDNGTLSITRLDPQSSTAITVNNEEQVPYNTVLTITTTPANDQYELDKLTVNGTDINSDSPYTVTDDVTINVTFSKKETKPDPVANEKIEANHPKVWKTGNLLHIQAVTGGQGFIYTIEGKLQKICRLTAGKIETVQLPAGIYLIRIGKESFKVVL